MRADFFFSFFLALGADFLPGEILFTQGLDFPWLCTCECMYDRGNREKESEKDKRRKRKRNGNEEKKGHFDTIY